MKHLPELCEWCWEIREERAAIHEFDGGATRKQADELAKSEQCPECRVFQEEVLWI